MLLELSATRGDDNVTSTNQYAQSNQTNQGYEMDQTPPHSSQMIVAIQTDYRNQFLWDYITTISTDPAPKLTKSILAPPRACPIMKTIEGNEQYDPLHLYNRRNPLLREQVCPFEVDIIFPRFRTASASLYYSHDKYPTIYAV